MSDLCFDLRNNSKLNKPDFDNYADAISMLAANALVNHSNSKSTEDASMRLFSFVHVPYMESDKALRISTFAGTRWN